MKIVKNNASIELSLDDFLDLLEEEALDDVLSLLEDLDNHGSISNKNWEDDFEDEDLDIFDEDFFKNYMSDSEVYYLGAVTEEEFEELMAEYQDGDDPFESLFDNLTLSNEDLKVKKIAQRFRHINEPF